MKHINFAPFKTREWKDKPIFDELIETISEIVPVFEDRLAQSDKHNLAVDSYFTIEQHYLKCTVVGNGKTKETEVFVREITKDDFLNGIAKETQFNPKNSGWMDLDEPNA